MPGVYFKGPTGQIVHLQCGDAGIHIPTLAEKLQLKARLLKLNGMIVDFTPDGYISLGDEECLQGYGSADRPFSVTGVPAGTTTSPGDQVHIHFLFSNGESIYVQEGLSNGESCYVHQGLSSTLLYIWMFKKDWELKPRFYHISKQQLSAEDVKKIAWRRIKEWTVQVAPNSHVYLKERPAPNWFLDVALPALAGLATYETLWWLLKL